MRLKDLHETGSEFTGFLEEMFGKEKIKVDNGPTNYEFYYLSTNDQEKRILKISYKAGIFFTPYNPITGSAINEKGTSDENKLSGFITECKKAMSDCHDKIVEAEEEEERKRKIAKQSFSSGNTGNKEPEKYSEKQRKLIAFLKDEFHGFFNKQGIEADVKAIDDYQFEMTLRFSQNEITVSLLLGPKDGSYVIMPSYKGRDFDYYQSDSSIPLMESMGKLANLITNETNFSDDKVNELRERISASDAETHLDAIEDDYEQLSEGQRQKASSVYDFIRRKRYQPIPNDNATRKKDDETRDIYMSPDFQHELKGGKVKRALLNPVIEEMVRRNRTQLDEYFQKKQLEYPGKFRYIRLKDNYRDRLFFCFGNEIRGRNPNDIFLIDYHIGHDSYHYEEMRHRDPNDINNFYLYRKGIIYDSQQKTIEDNAVVKPYHPIICIGCAGSGKTLMSAQMYEQRYKLMFSDEKPPLANEMIYLTYNETTLKSSKELILSHIPQVNGKTIKEFFIDILRDNKIDVAEKTIVGQSEFRKWWNEADFSKLFSNHQQAKKAKEFRDKFSDAFAYTIFRGIYKGSLRGLLEEEKKNNSDSPDWSDSLRRQSCLPSVRHFISTVANEEEGLSEDELKIFYEMLNLYQQSLHEKKLVDDNDLAFAVSTLYAGKSIQGYQCIIVDESQDLTERQMEALIAASSDKDQLIFFGDPNQSINPTILDLNKINGCLKKLYHNDNAQQPEKLTKSYRFSQDIAQYVNTLNKLRDKKLGTTDQADIETSMNSNPILDGYTLDNKLCDEILRRFKRNAHAVVLVSDEKAREDLLARDSSYQGRVYTISDAKGLEWEYVILYHILGDNRQEFMDILEDKAKYSTLHRMIFNGYYVAITRASKTFMVLEDESLPTEIKDNFLNESAGIVNIAKGSLDKYLKPKESSQDWFDEARRLFDNEEYINAELLFRKSNESERNDYIRYCQLMIDPECHTVENAELFHSVGLNRLSAKLYHENKDYAHEKFIKAIMGEAMLDAKDILVALRQYHLSDTDKEFLSGLAETKQVFLQQSEVTKQLYTAFKREVENTKGMK